MDGETNGVKTNGTAKHLTVQPVIFTDQSEDNKIMKEVFGPIVVINTSRLRNRSL
jgi:acyl-CoA reductase-like NAD-dependent aldehyde dehydrogenase